MFEMTPQVLHDVLSIHGKFKPLLLSGYTKPRSVTYSFTGVAITQPVELPVARGVYSQVRNSTQFVSAFSPRFNVSFRAAARIDDAMVICC